MVLKTISQVLSVIGVIILLNLVFFLGFLFAAFGLFSFFELFIAAFNFVLGGLTLKAALLTKRPSPLTGLEIIAYGLASLSAWFMINSLSLLPAGVIILAGVLHTVGASQPEPQRPPYYR